MKPIKLVIFDLDGTLGETLPLCIAAFRKAVEPLIGTRLTDEEIVATFGPSEEGTVMQLAPAHYERGIVGYLHFYYRLHDCCPNAFDGVVDLLEMLKRRGVAIAMVTGKGVHSTQMTLNRFGIAGYFDAVETGHMSGPRKVEGLEAVAARYRHISKEEMVYVGDAPSDIAASRKAGIPIAAAAWARSANPEALSAAAPDHIFRSIDELKCWLLESVALQQPMY